MGCFLMKVADDSTIAKDDFHFLSAKYKMIVLQILSGISRGKILL